MRVLVAAVAVFESQAGELRKGRTVAGFLSVALGAVDRLVLAGEGKIGLVVVEIRRRLEDAGVVAFRAIIAQGFLVGIAVAGGAVLLKAEKSVASFFQARIGDVIGLVALAAVDFLVGAREFVARQAVVEMALIEAHLVEILPMVVAVADCAVLAFDFGGYMVTQIMLYPPLDLLVAGQAFIVRDFVSQIMALRAIGNALQVLVGIGQWSGGQLRAESAETKQAEKGDM